MVKKLLKCLEEEWKKASLELKIDIGIAISHFQDEEIQTFLNTCFENVPAKDVQARAFGHVFGGLDNRFVADIIRLSMQDDGVNPTEDDVIKQIGVRAKHIADQINNQQQGRESRQQFLASPDILRNTSLHVLVEMGGKIYLDVKAGDGKINDRILPPTSASHVLVGA